MFLNFKILKKYSHGNIKDLAKVLKITHLKWKGKEIIIKKFEWKDFLKGVYYDNIIKYLLICCIKVE